MSLALSTSRFPLIAFHALALALGTSSARFGATSNITASANICFGVRHVDSDLFICFDMPGSAVLDDTQDDWFEVCRSAAVVRS